MTFTLGLFCEQCSDCFRACACSNTALGYHQYHSSLTQVHTAHSSTTRSLFSPSHVMGLTRIVEIRSSVLHILLWIVGIDLQCSTPKTTRESTQKICCNSNIKLLSFTKDSARLYYVCQLMLYYCISDCRFYCKYCLFSGHYSWSSLFGKGLLFCTLFAV
jgi:hypothetical protein